MLCYFFASMLFKYLMSVRMTKPCEDYSTSRPAARCGMMNELKKGWSGCECLHRFHHFSREPHVKIISNLLHVLSLKHDDVLCAWHFLQNQKQSIKIDSNETLNNNNNNHEHTQTFKSRNFFS